MRVSRRSRRSGARQPTLCSQTTGASSLAWRNGSSSSSHAAPRATCSSWWSSTAIARSDLHRVADAVLADDDVAGGVRLRVVDAETRRVQPAAAVAARSRVLASPRSADAPSRGSRSREPRRCRPRPPSRTPPAGCPTSTGCSVQSKLTAWPRARPTAHSRWGHNARGAE